MEATLRPQSITEGEVCYFSKFVYCQLLIFLMNFSQGCSYDDISSYGCGMS